MCFAYNHIYGSTCTALCFFGTTAIILLTIAVGFLSNSVVLRTTAVV